LYIDDLNGLYDCENQLLKALPLLIQCVSSLGLRKGFTQHLEETKTHLERLDQLFDDMGGRPKMRKCKAMRAILEEVMLDVMYEIPSLSGVSECVVTRDVVVSRSRPQLVREKKAS
jgi:ferritin-like metal-binding protein YciE